MAVRDWLVVTPKNVYVAVNTACIRFPAAKLGGDAVVNPVAGSKYATA